MRALLVLAALPLLLWSSVAFGRSARPLFVAVQQAYGHMTGVLEEFLSGVRVVNDVGTRTPVNRSGQ